MAVQLAEMMESCLAGHTGKLRYFNKGQGHRWGDPGGEKARVVVDHLQLNLLGNAKSCQGSLIESSRSTVAIALFGLRDGV